MKTPRLSRSVPVSAKSSASSASRDGIGMPPSPLCAGDVDVAKPIAPACMPSATSARIASTSAAVAVRRAASSRMTNVRTDECPTNAARLSPEPFRSSIARYSATVSKSHRIPARSASSDMPSTFVRLRIVRSRSPGRHGAIVNPQLPITAVVTPTPVDAARSGSHVTCAS